MSIDSNSPEFAALASGHCPDCHHRGFLLGPRGGAAMNIECGNKFCRSRFNVTTFGWDNLVMAERIQTPAMELRERN